MLTTNMNTGELLLEDDPPQKDLILHYMKKIIKWIISYGINILYMAHKIKLRLKQKKGKISIFYSCLT
jgi:hypothetical protein